MRPIEGLEEEDVETFMNRACHHLAERLAGHGASLHAVVNLHGLPEDADPGFEWLLADGRVDHLVACLDGQFVDASGIYEGSAEIAISHYWAGGELDTCVMAVPDKALRLIAKHPDWIREEPCRTDEVVRAILAMLGRTPGLIPG